MADTMILRMPQVIEKTGLARATVYKLVKGGSFPKPLKLGARAVGWRVADVQRWLESRPEGGTA